MFLFTFFIGFRESQVDELAMELLLLLVILPAVQDQNHTREWIKNVIRAWCSAAAWILDLRSYLFGDTEEDIDNFIQQFGPLPAPANANANGQNAPDQAGDAPQAPVAEAVAEPQPEQQQQRQEAPRVGDDLGLGAAHQALHQQDAGPAIGFQPYHKPKMFPLLVSNVFNLDLGWELKRFLFTDCLFDRHDVVVMDGDILDSDVGAGRHRQAADLVLLRRQLQGLRAVHVRHWIIRLPVGHQGNHDGYRMDPTRLGAALQQDAGVGSCGKKNLKPAQFHEFFSKKKYLI